MSHLADDLLSKDGAPRAVLGRLGQQLRGVLVGDVVDDDGALRQDEIAAVRTGALHDDDRHLAIARQVSAQSLAVDIREPLGLASRRDGRLLCVEGDAGLRKRLQ